MKKFLERMFRLNLFRAFLYPLRSWRRLALAWVLVPASLLTLVPLLLLGLGISATAAATWRDAGSASLGVILLIVLIGLIPGTFLAGYLLRARRVVAEGATALPPWNSWRALLNDGEQMGSLMLLMGVLPFACFWAGVGSVGAPLSIFSTERTWGTALVALLGSGVGLMFLLTALALWLLVMFFGPMASLRLAVGGGVLAALSPRGLFGDIRRGFGDYLLCTILLGAMGMAFSAASAAFWPLFFLSYPVQIYLQLVWASLLGQYARAYLKT